MFGGKSTESINESENNGPVFSENPEQPDVHEGKIYKDESTDSLVSKNEIWQFQRKYIMYQLESTL